MYKIFHNICPEYLCDGFTRVSDIHGHNTRSSCFNFNVPCIKSSQDSTFYYLGIKDWNALPDAINTGIHRTADVAGKVIGENVNMDEMRHTQGKKNL